MSVVDRYRGTGVSGLGVELGSYPLQVKSVVVACVVGLIGTIMFGSGLIGYALSTLCMLIGMTWRDDEPPAAPVCLGYQWIFVVSGYFYDRATGIYPGLPSLGDLDLAVLLSLTGLLAVALGFRMAYQWKPRSVRGWSYSRGGIAVGYDLKRLFWLTIAVYSVNWAFEIVNIDVWYEGSQIIGNILVVRVALLAALWLEAMEQGRKHELAIAATVFAVVPEMITGTSRFSGGFFLVLVLLLGRWRPWSRIVAERAESVRISILTGVICVVLVVLALGWQGGVKGTWRLALNAGEVTGSAMDKLSSFPQYAMRGLYDFSLDAAVGSVVERTASGVGYFSHVLNRVPGTVPHQEGELISRALQHVMLPRVFFPDKPNLGSDSWLVRIFAGLDVAGEESGTSVGLGYMAEFYIDYGTWGLLVLCVIYGLFVGLCCRGLILLAPSPSLYVGAVIAFLLHHFMTYEGEIAKLLGGMIASVLMFSILLGTVGQVVHHWLLETRDPAESRPSSGTRS